MNGGEQQLARVYASLDAVPPIDRPEPYEGRKWLNLSPAEAMNLPASDPVADEIFARSRAYGSMLERSLERTDAMLVPCQCGMATVFCACPTTDVLEAHRADCRARYGRDFEGDTK